MRLLYFTTLPRYSLAIFGWQALITATNWTVSSSVKACTPLSLAALELNVARRERTRSWGATLIPPDQPQPHNVLGIMPLRTDMNTVIECIVHGRVVVSLSPPRIVGTQASIYAQLAQAGILKAKYPDLPVYVYSGFGNSDGCVNLCASFRICTMHQSPPPSRFLSPFSQKKNTPTPTHLPVFVLFLKQMSPMMSRL